MFLERGDYKNEQSHLQQLARYIKAESLQRKDVLVVCQKPIRLALEEIGLPSNVFLEHFKNLRGVDQHRNVECAIIVGRSMPSNKDLEVMTEALHYDSDDVPDILGAGDKYHTSELHLQLSGEERETAIIQAQCHPDERVQAIARQVVDAEVRQAIMRLRLFDRTEDNPARLIVFGQCNTGLLVDELRDWTDARRSKADVLIACGLLCKQGAIYRKLGGGELEAYTQQYGSKVIKEALGRVHWPTWKCDRYKVAANPDRFRTASQVRGALKQLGVELKEKPFLLEG
jgi:uncharacterized protein YecE (DUF72 family)